MNKNFQFVRSAEINQYLSYFNNNDMQFAKNIFENIKFMSMKSNFIFLKELQREIKINSEGWKRQIAIVSYRIKFYFVYINASKIGLFFAKLLSYF